MILTNKVALKQTSACELEAVEVQKESGVLESIHHPCAGFCLFQLRYWWSFMVLDVLVVVSLVQKIKPNWNRVEAFNAPCEDLTVHEEVFIRFDPQLLLLRRFRPLQAAGLLWAGFKAGRRLYSPGVWHERNTSWKQTQLQRISIKFVLDIDVPVSRNLLRVWLRVRHGSISRWWTWISWL